VAHSMTGFGSAEGPVAQGQLHVDVRTVNHRHLNVQLKVPAILQELEGQLREILREHLHRGHVTLSARWIEEVTREGEISVNVERARDVVAAMGELKQALDLPGEVDLSFVARQPDVLAYGTGDVPAVEPEEVIGVVRTAVTELVAARRREGEALAAEIERLLSSIETELGAVEELSPARLTAERDRLRESVAALLDGKRADEDRLAQEIALLADKLDITEEIVRLRAHIDAVRDALTQSTPVGKRLSFLGQEMLREVNTIGSKANDAAIAHRVVSMKGELEKFREQIENLE
jgi:uncharacterized protein (TIGR00255 family)